MARDDDEQQAMTAERLAQIREWLEAPADEDREREHLASIVLNWQLLAEVERQRAALAVQEAREECKPMTDVERLETLRGMLTREVRLREAAEAREAALLAVVRAVADATEVHNSASEYVQTSWLAWPGLQRASRVQEQARALLASAETGEQAAQVDSAPHCDYCSQPWTVQAWRVNMDVREWLCATHFDDLSSDRLYRIERDRRSEQEEVLYSDEEAEAAYHSYEDDVFGEQAQGEA